MIYRNTAPYQIKNAMKRILPLLTLVLGLALPALSQCDSLYQKVVEDFSVNRDPNDRTVLPECWSIVYGATSGGREIGSVQQYNGTLLINSTYGGMAISPTVENANGTISFYASASGNVQLELGVYDNRGFNSVATFNSVGTHTYDFSDFQAQGSASIAFRHLGSNGCCVNITIDNIAYKSFCQPAEAPTAVAKDLTVKLDATGNVIVNPSALDNGSLDACGEPITNFSLEKTLFTCDDLGANEVTLTATDSEGQTATAQATLTVEPTISILNSPINLDEEGQRVFDVDYFLRSSSTLDCEAITYSLAQSTFTCEDKPYIYVEVIAAYSGDTVRASQIVGVVDYMEPVVIAQDISIEIPDSTGIALITTDMIDNGSSDNCGIATISLSKTSFTCGDQGENEVVLTITDESGNSASDTAIVTVGSFVEEVGVTSDATTVCFSGTETNSATISTDGSEEGVNYFLRKSADSSVVDGPIAGTGEALSFSTGDVTENTTYQIYAEVPFVGSALSLPGSSEYLAVSTPNSLDYSAGYTISAWINERAGGNSTMYNTLFYAGGATGSDIEVYQNSSSGVFTVLHNRDNGGTLSAYSFSTNYLPDSEWVHFAVTYDGATSRIYVNGELKVSNALVPPVKSASSQLTFGYLNSTTFPAAQVFGGKFDDIRIYSDPRSEAQLADAMRTCASGTDESLLLHFDMETISGTILTDLISNTPAQIINQNTGGLVDDGALSCSFTCSRIMASEITVGDDVAPTVVTRNLTLPLSSNGIVQITPAMVNNGSSDNCTPADSLIIALDKATFYCEDIGENEVTLTVTDQAGNSTSETATMTITSELTDETITASETNLCPGSEEGAIISTSGSVAGVNYFLRDAADSTIIDGPILGTGEAIDFNTGVLAEETSFQVLAQSGSATSTSLSFEKGNQYVAAGEDSTFQYDSAYTIEMWVNSDFPVSFSNALINYGTSSISDIEIYVQGSSGRLTIVHGRVNGSAQSYFQYPVPVKSSWTHIAVTYDGREQEIKVYYDGVEQTQFHEYNPTVALVKREGATLNIGRVFSFNSSSDSYSGLMDEVRVWDTVRTAQQIADFKDFCLTGEESGLVSYFQFDEGADTLAVDLAGGNNGILTGMDPETDWSTDSPISCVGCSMQMSTSVTITVGDEESPEVLTKNISLVLGESGTAEITPADIDNGTLDNCTSEDELTYSLDITSFGVEDVGENTVTLSVEDANGNIGTATAIVSVSDKELQVLTLSEVPELTFGGDDFTLTATTDSELSVSFSVISGGLEITESSDGSATFSINTAGEATIRLSNEGNSTYAPLQLDTVITIAKADQELTVSEISNQSNLVTTVEVEAEVSTGLELTYGVTGPATNQGNVISLEGTLGTVTVTVSQVGNENYNEVSQTISFEVVEKTAQSIALGELPSSVTYGSASIALSATASSSLTVGFVLLDGPGSLTDNTLGFSGVGTIQLAAVQLGDETYLPADTVFMSIAVNAASLVVTADDQEMVFGSEVPTLTLTYSGFVNGETENVLSSLPQLSTDATSTSDVSTYAINVTGGAAANYSISNVTGLLTITPASAQVSIVDLEHTVDGTPKQPTITTDPEGLNYLVTFDGEESAPTAIGSYAVEVTIDEVNYEGSATATLVISTVLGQENLDIQVYPNPTSETFRISSPTRQKVELFDLTGQLKLSGYSNQLLDVTALSAGAYLIRIEGGGIYKLIKK